MLATNRIKNSFRKCPQPKINRGRYEMISPQFRLVGKALRQEEQVTAFPNLLVTAGTFDSRSKEVLSSFGVVREVDTQSNTQRNVSVDANCDRG